MDWTLIQDIISGIAIALLILFIKIAIKRNKERKRYEEEQAVRINKLIDFQQQHTKETNRTQRELELMRVDIKCVTYALEMTSNGNKYKDFINEKREELMAQLDFKYKD